MFAKIMQPQMIIEPFEFPVRNDDVLDLGNLQFPMLKQLCGTSGILMEMLENMLVLDHVVASFVELLQY